MTPEELAEIEDYLAKKGIITPSARRHVMPVAAARARLVVERREYEASVAPEPSKEERFMAGVWYEDDQRIPGARPSRAHR